MIIGVSSCVEILDAPHHSVFDKYLDYIVKGMGYSPLMIPCMGKRYTDTHTRYQALREMIKRLDGVLLTGSPSNVEPGNYGERNEVLDQDGNVDVSRIDLDRDSTTLPIVRICMDEGIPLFGICRGMQEINVALGGTLYQHLPIEKQVETHRVHKTDVFEEKYVGVHKITIEKGGVLEKELKRFSTAENELVVNSLHRQAVKELGTGLRIEAVSEDGVIEALSLDPRLGDVIAVQWHPEWYYEENIANNMVRRVFKEMCEKRYSKRSSRVKMNVF
ncbi:gamma-glutamyl-gamma-aminobutyrate hydrolase family protein [Saccharospirillum salsuginis]|uniref:Glutamine amidotransferase n=1 Tax=Saccharospirillum salsuginis TaxID=418750 RepID=A0A918KB65_9GAMM|nr:gamma-glutamyl-gamma-aminobutyrate hydrolase family protein [Saccharospirillum salsuginis]GGX57574.1 glutamine amidotransferase [Saccharospirillum salsuginis]